MGGAPLQHSHRTIILCSQDEVQAVFELRKKACFDHYVLYWPYSHDGPRLAMSLWNACRAMTAQLSGVPQRADPYAHASHVGELDRLIGREIGAADQVARRSMPGHAA
jgi:hypothetical protein